MKLAPLIVSSAFLLSACGGTVTMSASSSKPVTRAVMQVKAGPNAGSDVSDTDSRPNHSFVKPGILSIPAAAGAVSRPTPSNHAGVTVQTNDNATTRDRCSGFGGSGKPKFMCAPA